MSKNISKILSILLVFAGILFFIGCQDQQSINNPENGFNNLNKETNLVIPGGSTVVSATLKIFQLAGNNTQNNIHRITSPWEELTVTGNNFGGYDPAVISSFLTSPSFDDNWNSVDVTALVLGWLNGSFTNYGLLIDQFPAGSGPEDRSVFYSRENDNPTIGERMPYLEITLSTGVVIELGTIGDTYITIGTDDNRGNFMTLNTGYSNSTEKQTLIKFNILPQCYQDETAWAANGTAPGSLKYNLRGGNWATYLMTPASGSKTVNVYAGKTIYVGQATITRNNGTVSININLVNGWQLDSNTSSEAVKIQGYNNAPSGNPSPGLFTTYKGNSLSITVPSFNYYGIHLDVTKVVSCQ